MNTRTKIEWTDVTWNPVVGCTRASAGCDNCYAVAMTHRLEAMGQKKYSGLTVLNGKGDRQFNGVVRCDDSVLSAPLTWRKPRRVFVNSMSDLFHRDVPFDFIDKVFAVMALCPQHTFQILTKRPKRMREYISKDRYKSAGRHGAVLGAAQFQVWTNASTRGNRDQFAWPLPNVWLGTSCEDQATADQRIPHLRECPAAVRFLSLEPLLGGINLMPYVTDRNRINWVIVGGESGPRARPCYMEWVRSIVRQCKASAVPVFVKQLGRRACDINEAAKLARGCVTDEKHSLVSGGWKLDPNWPEHPKGADPVEWPEELRVREVPL